MFTILKTNTPTEYLKFPTGNGGWLTGYGETIELPVLSCVSCHPANTEILPTNFTYNHHRRHVVVVEGQGGILL